MSAVGPRWRYLLAELTGGLRANLLMTLATILTVTVSLTLGGAGLLTQRQVDITSRLFYSQVEVSIFLVQDVGDAQRSTLQSDLEANPQVETYFYESPEQAYENYQEIFADDETLLASIGPDDLPASFRVKLVDPEEFAVVASQYGDYPGVQEITDQSDILDRLFGLLNAFKIGGFAIAGLQLAGGAALIANTIRLSAFARREQIGIMKLVGATNWYIQLPFVLEGVVAGIIGSIGAVLLLLIGEATLIDALRGYIQFIPLVGTDDVLAIVPLLLLIGAGVAATASSLSLRRFLDV